MFDAAAELQVREKIATRAATVANVGAVTPSPLYFTGPEDFWATIDNTKNTRNEIDLEPIAGLWLYPQSFTDVNDAAGCLKTIRMSYQFYLFRQYARERGDESETPELFDSQCLAAHNAFIDAWLGLKGEFQGNKRNVGGMDPLIFASVKTNSMTQPTIIENLSPCEFVPTAAGFAVRLEMIVDIVPVGC